MIEAWVNWNPEPKVHAFGDDSHAHVLALCRVVVRERRGEFDVDAADACEDCAEFVRAGLTFELASAVMDARMRERMNDPSVIVCRRGR